MYIFGGSASTALANKIAASIGGKLGEVETTYFANGEMRVWIKSKNAGRSAIVVQSFTIPVNGHIVEFCFLCDALYRMGVHDITAVIPWLGYSKQDKVFRPGEALSAKVVAKIVQVVPITRLLTFDLHNLAILGFFDIPVTNLSARPLFVDYFKKKLTAKTVVVAPDAGAVKSSTVFANELGVPVAYMDKNRDLVTGEVTVQGISRKVRGSDVIIIDDMIVTGETLVETAKYLKKEQVRTISVAATHHLYVPGAQEAIEKSGIDSIMVTDTISKPAAIKSKKLTILSVAPLAAESLKQHEG